ncbi:MAG: type II toxin-antitoxin system RelE/ParE family toxin, partial [Methylobacter sp.]
MARFSYGAIRDKAAIAPYELRAEPVRDWLKSLPEEERKAIGEDIKAAQYGWPLGLPLVGHIDGDIWEV